MKAKSVLFLSIALVLSISSCDMLDIFDHNDEPKALELNKKAAEIIEADQQFAFELFHQVCSLSTEDNIMISPLSAAYALGMTYNGAAGTTRDAFNNVLHFDGLSTQEVNESYKDLMGQLVTLDDKVEFSIANSIWHVDWADIIQDFIDLNQEYFDANVAGLDFSDPASVDIINDWIEQKTNNKIKDMLDYIPGTAYMYLINAIYFNAEWKFRFDKDNTVEGDFYLDDGSTESVDYMNLEADLNYLEAENYSAVELPYGDGAFSMVAFLPAYGTSIDNFLLDFDSELWDDFNSRVQFGAVGVSLPKFKYEFKKSLDTALMNLGLEVAFTQQADFSGITDTEALYISRVLHQTYIDVNEEGTEAAAATIVEMSYKTGNVVFNAINPFLYIIKENSTGAIVFMGKVGRPDYHS